MQKGFKLCPNGVDVAAIFETYGQARAASDYALQVNQMISGPINAHLIPGIHPCTFIYSPRAEAVHPMGTKV